MNTSAKSHPNARELLVGYGFPDIVLNAWESEGITELLPIQRRALEANLLSHGSFLVVGPTTCGKTFVGEMVCVKHALEGRRCLYLVPFKALAEEKYREFQAKYSRDEIGATVLISTADRREQDRRLAEGDFNIAILTYEKLSALLILHPSLLRDAGALVVDEVQMVCDDSRGAELELLLTRAQQIAPNLQVIGLSAVVSELNGFDEWLGAAVIQDDHRPVPLREGVIAANGMFQFMEWIEATKTPGTEQFDSLHGDNEEALAVAFAAQLLKNDTQQILVFTNTVANTQALAKAISNRVSCVRPATDTIRQLSSIESSESIEALAASLKSAVAFHNADLTFEERIAVEDGFRSRQIRCVVATATLSMGVNLPASTVIIVKPKKWTRQGESWQEVDTSVAEYRNMSGRAGRYGLLKDDFGRSVLITKSPLEQKSRLNRFVNGVPEPIESAFLKRPLPIFLLRIFASGLCDNANGAQRFLLKTFAAKQAWQTDPEKSQLDWEVNKAIERLTAYKLIEVDDGGKLAVTNVGRICAGSGLEIDSFGRLLSFVFSGNTSELDIARLAAQGEETGIDRGVSVRMQTAEYEGRTRHFLATLRHWCDVIASGVTELFLDQFCGDQGPTYEQAKEMKYQSVAMAYATGIASLEIETKLGVSAGKARAIGSMCAWLSDTAAQIAWGTGKIDEAKRYEVIGERFSAGCGEAALFLSRVPNRLFRAEREKLVQAGFTSFQKFIDADATDIAKTSGVNRARIQGLQKGIVDTLGDELELERQQVARLYARGESGDQIERLYTASGVGLEQALEDILVPPFCPLKVSRITKQRHGEADLKIVLSTGHSGIVQVHAREKPNALVGVVKAGAVLQQSPELKPEVFICIGRPDFDGHAIEAAQSHTKNGKNYKLIPISVLAEMFVRFHEKTLLPERVAQILETELGQITIDRV